MKDKDIIGQSIGTTVNNDLFNLIRLIEEAKENKSLLVIIGIFIAIVLLGECSSKKNGVFSDEDVITRM